MLCIEMPATVTTGLLDLLDKREDENCDFDEFLSAIKTILLYDSYFEEMESIFRHLDNGKTGKIRIADLVSSLQKLRQADVITLHELRVPEPSEVESIYKKITAAGTIESPNLLNRSEYLTIMFKVT
jgi:Ca2+-binding EF-hand superfamily protein